MAITNMPAWAQIVSVCILGIIGLAAVCCLYLFRQLKTVKSPTWTENPYMDIIAKSIREGVEVFVKGELCSPFGIGVVSIVVFLFFAFVMNLSVSLAFMTGTLITTLGIFLGERVGTFVNKLTAARADMTGSIPKTFEVAMKGGGICGLICHAGGLLGMVLVFMIWGTPTPGAFSHGLINLANFNISEERFLACSLGFSITAIYARIPGGIFAKSADSGADLFGKVAKHLKEDDWHNPITLLDAMADLVCDIIANMADITESMVGVLAAGVIVASNLFERSGGYVNGETMLVVLCILPLIINAIGLLSGAIGMLVFKKYSTNTHPLTQLGRLQWFVLIVSMILSTIVCYPLLSKYQIPEWKLGWISIPLSILIGQLCGLLGGKSTDHSTSDSFPMTRNIAKIASEGPAIATLYNITMAAYSVVPLVAIALVFLNLPRFIGGEFCVIMASVGLFASTNLQVGIDACGAISDTSGAIVTSSQCGANARRGTDGCDKIGNTKAAVTKDYAIFGAIGTVNAFLCLFRTSANINNLTVDAYTAINGGAIATVIMVVFSALLVSGMLSNTYKLIHKAKKYYEQLGEYIDELNTLADQPNTEEKHAKIQSIANKMMAIFKKLAKSNQEGAFKKMVNPALLPILATIAIGLIGGNTYLYYSYIFITVIGLILALFMSNFGSSADNAKKCNETLIDMFEELEDKAKILDMPELAEALHSDLFILDECTGKYIVNQNTIDTSVVLDCEGDPAKDQDAVCYDIVMKIMMEIGVMLVPLFARYCLLDNWGINPPIVNIIVLAIAIAIVAFLYFRIRKDVYEDLKVQNEED